MTTTPLPTPFLTHMRNGVEFNLFTAEQVQQARADLEAEVAKLRDALDDIAYRCDVDSLRAAIDRARTALESKP